MFANGPGDLRSIQGRVIPKARKWYFMPPCLTPSLIRYGSRVNWINPGKGVAPFSTPCCSCNRKKSLRATVDHSRRLYLLIISSPDSYISRRTNKAWIAVNRLTTLWKSDLSEKWGFFLAKPYLCKCMITSLVLVRNTWRKCLMRTSQKYCALF